MSSSPEPVYPTSVIGPVTAFRFQDEDLPFEVRMGKRRRDAGAPAYHAHPDTLEIHYIQTGAGYYFIRNQRYPIRERTLLVIQTDDVHSYVGGPDGPSEFFMTTVYFKEQLFANLSPEIRQLAHSLVRGDGVPHSCLRLTEKDATELEFHLDLLQREWDERGPHSTVAIQAACVHFCVVLSRLMRAPQDSGVIGRGERNELVEEVIDVIRAQYASPLSLTSIAAEVGRSPFHISHLFNRYAGVSFRDYLCQTRIAESKRRLERGDGAKIASIAFDVGFNDVRNFNRTFKRYTGVTPSQYRNFYMTLHAGREVGNW